MSPPTNIKSLCLDDVKHHTLLLFMTIFFKSVASFFTNIEETYCDDTNLLFYTFLLSLFLHGCDFIFLHPYFNFIHSCQEFGAIIMNIIFAVNFVIYDIHLQIG